MLLGEGVLLSLTVGVLVEFMMQFLLCLSSVCQSRTLVPSEEFLGRFNAPPANAVVPLAGESPEEWQFQARAVRRDQEIGHPSPVLTAIIRN